MSNDPLAQIATHDLAATFAALGDPRRLALVGRLHGGKALSITTLCEGMDISRQAISKHLNTLAEAQLVSATKAGRETRYSLEQQKLDEANDFLDRIGKKWEDALDRLKAHLDD